MSTYVMYTCHDFKSHEITGGTKRFLELLYGLVANDVKIHLFIPENAEIIKHNNIIVHPVKFLKSRYLPNGLLSFIANFYQLLKIRKIKYDHLLIIGIPYAIQCVILNLKHLTFVIWEDFVHYRVISLESKQFPLFIKVILKSILIRSATLIESLVFLKSQKIIVQCEYDKNVHIQRHKKIETTIANKFKVIYNNVNPSWLEAKCITTSRVSSNEKFKILFIGNISDRRKGVDILLNVSNQLIRNNYPIQVSIVGGGKLLDKYKNQYSDLKPFIHFHGPLLDPIPVLLESDLLVVPSIADSFPNTIMEAFFYCIPVIGSNKGGIPEMLKFKELIFNIDGNELYDKLITMINDRKILELYRDLAFQRKKELTFNWIEAMKEIIEN